MNPQVLTVYQSPYNKKRLGKNYDGGYIIVDLPNANYDLLIAGGISNDISFEEDFIKNYNNVKTFAFDGTISSLPNHSLPITFVKKNIGGQESDRITNIHQIIKEHTNIFVKMDIEGGEVEWIKSLDEEMLNKFEQIVIEFHNPFSQKEIPMFDKINKYHYLVHFHANNCCGVRMHKNVVIPNVFECTYLHKKYFPNIPEKNKTPIPGPLDMKNVLRNNEIHINHPPFVNH